MEGWIKLHRRSLESIIFTSEKGWKIWTWCLLKANHNKNTFFLGRQKISLNAGQFVMGRNTASQELGIAVGTIWYWLDILESEGNIERKSTNKYSIITILKWEEYQSTERRLNADRTQIEQQIEPNKNVKNDKNEKNTIIASAPALADINKLLTLFYQYNPTLNFGSITQRKALQDILDKIGEKKTIEAIQYALSIQGKKYAPVITTPLQLKNKLGDLRAYYERSKNSKVNDNKNNIFISNTSKYDKFN